MKKSSKIMCRVIAAAMIISMAEVVENKSDQTGQHVRRVAEYSKVLAMQLGFT